MSNQEIEIYEDEPDEVIRAVEGHQDDLEDDETEDED